VRMNGTEEVPITFMGGEDPSDSQPIQFMPMQPQAGAAILTPQVQPMMFTTPTQMAQHPSNMAVSGVAVAAMNIRVKVTYNGDTRLCREASWNNFEGLRRFIASSWPERELIAQYQDVDGDLITITSNNDLMDAFNTARIHNANLLRIFVRIGHIAQRNNPNISGMNTPMMGYYGSAQFNQFCVGNGTAMGHSQYMMNNGVMTPQMQLPMAQQMSIPSFHQTVPMSNPSSSVAQPMLNPPVHTLPMSSGAEEKTTRPQPVQIPNQQRQGAVTAVPKLPLKPRKFALAEQKVTTQRSWSNSNRFAPEMSPVVELDEMHSLISSRTISRSLSIQSITESIQSSTESIERIKDICTEEKETVEMEEKETVETVSRALRSPSRALRTTESIQSITDICTEEKETVEMVIETPRKNPPVSFSLNSKPKLFSFAGNRAGNKWNNGNESTYRSSQIPRKDIRSKAVPKVNPLTAHMINKMRSKPKGFNPLTSGANVSISSKQNASGSSNVESRDAPKSSDRTAGNTVSFGTKMDDSLPPKTMFTLSRTLRRPQEKSIIQRSRTTSTFEGLLVPAKSQNMRVNNAKVSSDMPLIPAITELMKPSSNGQHGGNKKLLFDFSKPRTSSLKRSISEWQ